MRLFSNSPLSWSGDSSNGIDSAGKSPDEGFVEQLSPDLDILSSFNNLNNHRINGTKEDDDDVAAMDMYGWDPTIDELIFNGHPYQNHDILDLIDFNELELVADNTKNEPSNSEPKSELTNVENPPKGQLVAPAQMIVDFEDSDEVKSEPCSPLAPHAVPTELVIVQEQKNSQQLTRSSPTKLAKSPRRKVPNIQPKLLYRPLVKNAVLSANNTVAFNSESSSTANLIHSPPRGASTTVVVLDTAVPQVPTSHSFPNNIKVNAAKTTQKIAPMGEIAAILSQQTNNVISTPTTCNNNVLSPVLINTTTSNSTLCLNNIDYRMFKQQQRKIKNRESACLSRKKKKDYVTQLENQISDLIAENNRLREENAQLKENLHRCERINSFFGPSKNFKKSGSVALCIVLFMVGFQFSSIRTPSVMKHQQDLIKDEFPESNRVLDHHANGRNLLWMGDLTQNGTTANSNFMSLSSMCPAAINQTESARLVLELERLIANAGGASYDSIMMPPSRVVAPSVKLPLPYKNRSPNKQRRKPKPKKYVRLDDSNFHRKKSRPADDVPSAHYLLSYERRSPTARKLHQQRTTSTANGELQVFAPSRDQLLYGEFFEAINRQDDTFYVVSFSDHHMLLPALYHNKTRRPKMSLIMPSMLQSDNNSSRPTQMPLMQIDCEVLDTRLLQVNYGSIPQHLRSSPTTGNTTTASPTNDYHHDHHHDDERSSETVTSEDSKRKERYDDESYDGRNSSFYGPVP